MTTFSMKWATPCTQCWPGQRFVNQCGKFIFFVTLRFRLQYQHVTGTRCSTDFAEVPSTLMEYFSSDPRVLSMIGKHYKTGESLPEDVTKKFCATKKVFNGVDIQTQLFYSLIDQKFHQTHPLGCSTTEALQQLHQEHHSLPYHDNTAWHHRFSHLVGYGARYYSYLMARAVASSIWQKYFQADPLIFI